MTADSEDIPAWLRAPATESVAPPGQPKAQLLPFDSLSPGNFERLCLAVVRLESGEPERCRIYGVSGQSQAGIDLFARHGSGVYSTFQCKRYQSISAGDIDGIVELFVSHDWRVRSTRFVLCTGANCSATQVTNAIERNRDELAPYSIDFDVWDAEELSRRLKNQQEIVLDFFGRAWVDHFCAGSLTAAPDSSGRLDADEVATLRSRLRDFYDVMFSRHRLLDSGQAGPLHETYVPLDVISGRVLPTTHRERSAETVDVPVHDREAFATPSVSMHHDHLTGSRASVEDWVSSSRRCLLIGGAGSGKTTFLQALCLDLLSDTPRQNGPASSGFLAVWVPFGRWARYISDGDLDTSLPELLERFFHAFGADDLWRLVSPALQDNRLVLLIDGLDEWSDLDAAGVAGERLQQYVAHRDIPAVACGRPEALRAFRVVDADWAVATQAPLTEVQQSQVVRSLLPTSDDVAGLLRRFRRAPALGSAIETPLLLVLAARLETTGRTVPNDGNSLISAFVSWLITERAPERRRIAHMPDVLGLDVDEMMSLLEQLGLEAQLSDAPVLRLGDARDSLAKWLVAEPLIGGTIADARPFARRVLQEAIGPIGLLTDVGDGQLVFAHRALQEHLAGMALSRLDDQEQFELASAHGSQINWRNVLEVMVWSARNPAHAEDLVAAVRMAAIPGDNPDVVSLLTLLALRPSHLSQTTRMRLVEDAAQFVESDGDDRVKATVLDALVDGRHSPGIGTKISGRIRAWWPARNEDRGALLEATLSWPPEPETEELWWRCLRDEDTRVAQAAGAIVAQITDAKPSASSRLDKMLTLPLSERTRAVALETLGRGWPDHPSLPRRIAQALASPSPDLQLVGVDLKVRRDSAGDDDLEIALALASGWTLHDHQRKEQIAVAIAKGWPENPQLLELALTTVSDEDRRRPLDISFATWLLVTSFNGNEAVRNWVKGQLGNDHPFVLLDDQAWRVIGEVYRDDPEIVPLLHRTLQADPHRAHIPRNSMLARGLHTREARDYLLSRCQQLDGWPSLGWVFGALAEEWMDDEDVKHELRRIGRSGHAKVAQASRWFETIFSSAERHSICLEMLRSGVGEAAPLVRTLADHSDVETRREVVALALDRISPDTTANDGLAAATIDGFPDDPRVDALCVAEFSKQHPPLGTLGRAARGRPHLREQLRQIASPLGTALRRRLTQRMFETRSPLDTGGASGSPDWRLEADAIAAATAASSFASSTADRDASVQRALEGLRTPRLFEAQSQAGFCALLEMRELEHFRAARWWSRPHEPMSVDLGSIHPNWWMISRIATHFEYVREVLGESLGQRLGASDDARSFWAALAPFASHGSALFATVLDFVLVHGTGSHPSLLRFLARARPRSEPLKTALLENVRGYVRNRSPETESLFLCAGLIPEHFHSIDVRDELLSDLRQHGHATHGEALALAEGWHDDHEVRTLLAGVCDRPDFAQPDVHARLQLGLADGPSAIDALARWLRYGATQQSLMFPPTSTALRRAGRDATFVEALSTRVQATSDLSMIATGTRVLAAVGMLSDELRTHLLGVSQTDIEHRSEALALDMLAERIRPFPTVLRDALALVARPA